MEDAIINMSINAMHAIKGNGKFTIRTDNVKLSPEETQLLHLAPGDYICLSLTDTGIGMDDETREQIFDPFFSTKGEKRTGLGLSQVYGFVEHSSGAIKVQSEPGKGSCFTLYFPRTLNSEPKSREEKDLDQMKLFGSESILVVDDEPALMRLNVTILETQGSRVLTAKDGEQALQRLEKETVDLIISDVIIPGMYCYQFAAQVQKRYPKIKLQMVSGFPDDLHNKTTESLLYQNMLYKPYASKTLLAHVRSLLDESKNPIYRY